MRKCTFCANHDDYPNPSTGAFNIEFSEEPISQVRVYDLAGRSVDTKQMNLLTNRVSLDLNAPSGIYLLEIRTESGKFGMKKIKVLKN